MRISRGKGRKFTSKLIYNSIKRYFGHCSAGTKIRLFRAYRESLYTSHLWGHYPNKSFLDIRTAYNNMFRLLMAIPRAFSDNVIMMISSASFMFASRGVPSFQEVLRRGAYSFLNRIRSSKNSILMGLLGSDCLYRSSILMGLKRSLYTVFR